MSRQAKRNILLMMTDQQRFDTIAATGNSVIKTPNLDRLAGMGTAFTHAFTPQPMCGPARHSVFTGTNCCPADFQRNRANWRPDSRFMPEILAESGYRAGGFGKFHFYPERAHHGFQHYAVQEEMNHMRREDQDYRMYLQAHGLGHIPYSSGVRGLLYFQPQRSLFPEEHHETKWVADRGLDFLDKFSEDPFFLFVSWIQPHWPVNVPDSFADMYDNKDMPLPVFAENEKLPWFEQMQQNASDVFDKNRFPAERMKRLKALYYASISFVDKQVGRVLDELEAKQLLDETLIIFTSDHGELLGDHRTFSKVSCFDPSIRVPMIVAGPGIEQGVLSDEFVSLYDIAPTVYEFAGVAPPAGTRLLGNSLFSDRALIRQRDRVLYEMGDGTTHGSFVSVRTRKWKYNFHHTENIRQLFDMENDPSELNNLYSADMTAEHRRIASELHQSLLDWNADQGYASRIENGDFKVLPPGPVWFDRNTQYDTFIDYLPEKERKELWSEARVVYEAVKNERFTDLAKLDLEFWEQRLAPGGIAELEQLMGRKLRN